MKKTDHIRYVLIIMFGAGLLGYLLVSSWSLSSAAYRNISVDQFIEMMNNKDFILINVHVPYEGEIARTDLHIPFNVIGNLEKDLPDKDAKIVLYCMSGRMSRTAAERLSGMGYTQLFNLHGGMRSWKENGKQIQYRSS